MPSNLARRAALKIGAFGVTALTPPFIRTLSAGTASQMAASKLPRPYSLPFRTPPVARATVTASGAAFYRIEQACSPPRSSLWGEREGQRAHALPPGR